MSDDFSQYNFAFPLHRFSACSILLCANKLPGTSILQRKRISGIVILDPGVQILGLAYLETAGTFALENVNVEGHDARKIGGADGIRIRQLYGNKGVLRRDLAF
jgi:hypothetical protein